MLYFLYMVKVFRNIMIGFGMGAIATAVYLTIALHLQLPVLGTDLILKQLLGSMAFGAYCGLLALIYDWGKDRVRRENVARFLILRTVLNFLMMLTGYLITGQWLGWFYNSTVDSFLFWSLGSFLLLYLLIWFFFYIYNRNTAKILNKGLRKI